MADRRTQILDAAARLVSEQGYTATSIDDVIRAAGLSGKSHFYHYFKSKEELGYAVLGRQFERFADRGLAILREPMIAPLERLYLFIDSLVTAQAERGGKGGSLFGNLAGEMADAHEGFRERIEGVFEQWAAQITALLEEARGELVEGTDAARLSRFIIAALEGALLMARVNRDVAVLYGIAADLKRFIGTHVRPPARVVPRRPARGLPGRDGGRALSREGGARDAANDPAREGGAEVAGRRGAAAR